MPLAKSSGPRRHGDSGRSKQAVRCGLPVNRPELPNPEISWPAVFPECVDDLALTESRVIIREGCRTLPAKRVVTVELCLIDSQRYSADSFARRSKYGRARRANRGRRFRPDTPGLYVFRSQSLVRYPPTDSLVPKRNDRQKIELNVEIFEGHLGCMKSTHSMNAATWGR